MASTVCTQPGCPNFATYRGRCDTHHSDRQRPDSTARGYDRKWARTRGAYLHAHPNCEARGCNARAVEVHHLDGLGPTGPNGHKWHNLQALCTPCHARTTATMQPGGWNAR